LNKREVKEIGLDPAVYGTHTLRRTKVPTTPSVAGRRSTVTYSEEIGNSGHADLPGEHLGYQFVLKYVYDAYGFLNQTKDNAAGTVFWTLNSAKDSNLPTSETLGNGAHVVTGYTPRTNEMTTRTEGSGGPTTNLQDLAYNWDLAGNLHQGIDNRQNLTEQFAYDSMNRLLNSTLNGATKLTMTYDAAGNINTNSYASHFPYVYDTVHKHAVKTADGWSMTYDANGNMITRVRGGCCWHRSNTISYNGNYTQFFHNASHQRWKQVASYSGTIETTRYVGGLLEIMTRVRAYRVSPPGSSRLQHGCVHAPHRREHGELPRDFRPPRKFGSRHG